MAALPEPAGRGAGLDLAAGAADQAHDDLAGEPQPGIAVGAGLLRAGLAVVDGQPDEHAGDRGAARVVGVEDLREEGAEGHERGVDRLVVGDALGGQGVLDHGGVQDLGEGEALVLLEGIDRLGQPVSGTLGHGRSPGRVRLGSLANEPCPKGDRLLSIP